jgi:HlyD family secretion protein
MPSFKTLLIAVVVIGAAGTGYWYFNHGSVVTDTQSYQTEKVTIGRIESLVNTAGTISPVVTVDVGSEVSGLVSELYADFNSEVKKGQVIARIDDRTIRSRLRQTEADVASAQASLLQQQAGLQRAESDLLLAQQEVKRMRELIERQLASQSDLDKAEATLKTSTAQLAIAKAQVTAAEASIQQRQAQLEQAQLDLDRTYIRSPVDGTVIDRQVDVGQTVAASLSAPLLFQIAADLTQMQIEADVDEADIGQVKEGLEARFTVDAFPDRTFTGRVTQVRKAATVTSNVVTYKVIIGAENPRQQLLPGMTANVNLVLGEKDDVMRVNNSALRFNPPGVEESNNRGGFAGNISERLDGLTAELDLNAEQRKALEAALEDMQSQFEQMRQSGGFGGGGFAGGGFPGGGRGNNQGDRFQQIRQRMINQLAGKLTPEQLTKFEASFGGGRGGPGGGGFQGQGGSRPDFANMTRGQIWVLENGEPKRLRVLVGLSDNQYSEVVSDELKEGDDVIVRLAR